MLVMATVSPYLSRFRGDARRIAAAEFALVRPVRIVVSFGTVALTRILDANRKLTLFARTPADLSGRADNPKPTAGDMTTIAGATAVILRLLDASGLQIAVDAMGVESVGGTLCGGICSSWSQNAAQRPALRINGTNGLPATPATYRFDGARYILARVSMADTPIIGSARNKWIFGSRGLVFIGRSRGRSGP